MVYEINGIKEHKLSLEFRKGFKDGSNPLLQLDSNFLNMKLVFNGEIEHVKINEKIINGDELKQDYEDYILLYSLPITKDEKEISIKVVPSY